MFYSFGWESSLLLKERTAAKTNVTFKKSFCFASTLLSLVLHSSCSLTSMDKFLKKRKLDKGEDSQDLRQPYEATSSKLPKNDGINQQVKVRRYCKSYVALRFTWTGNPDCPSPLCIVCGELKHSEFTLDAFWLLVKKEHPAIAQKALRLLSKFSTSYLCEFGFSALTTITNKKRAQLLCVEDELRVCLSKTRPNIKELCKKHQAQISH